MRRRLAGGLAASTLFAGAALAWASLESAHGPIPGSTGAFAVGGKPAEFDCTLCHDSNPLNAASGKVQILGVPSLYTPGQTYPITVRLSNTATAGSPGRKWGFELTAVRASDGTSTGTMILPAPDTLQLTSGDPPWTGRTYVEHTFEGTRTGLGGPVTWTFQWQAPATSQGTIYFFCAGNSADGSGDTLEDWIFTTRDSSFALGTVDVPSAVSPGRLALAFSRQPVRSGDQVRVTFADESPAALELFDAGGRRLWSDQWSSGSLEVQLRALPAGLLRGVYWLRLTQAGNTTVSRLVYLP